MAEKFGIRYDMSPLSSFTAPSEAAIAHALSLLVNPSSAKIYVHCLRGKDRTGTVIACYRIQHDGWDNQKALAEAKSYGSAVWKSNCNRFPAFYTAETALASSPQTAPFSSFNPDLPHFALPFSPQAASLCLN